MTDWFIIYCTRSKLGCH